MRTKEKEEKGKRRRKRREKGTKLKEERRTNGCQQLLTDFVSNSFLSSNRTYSPSPPHPPLLSVGRMVITRATHLSLRQPPQSQWDAQKKQSFHRWQASCHIRTTYLNRSGVNQLSAATTSAGHITERERETYPCTQSYTWKKSD